MNFEVDDEVVYNPCLPDLEPAAQRPGDWGTIVKISNSYIYFRRYCWMHDISKILMPSMSHSPRSPKYFRNIYAQVISDLPTAALEAKDRKYRKNYANTLDDIRMYGQKYDHDMFMRSLTQDMFSASASC